MITITSMDTNIRTATRAKTDRYNAVTVRNLRRIYSDR